MPVVGDIYSIEARVREIDPRLVVVFDYVKERYVVYEQVRKCRHEAVTASGADVFTIVDELAHVTTIQNDDGSFRPLDTRLLDDLIRMDSQRDEKWFDKLREDAKKKRESAKKARLDHTERVARHYAPLVKKELKYGL